MEKKIYGYYMILLNCAFPKRDGTVPMYETFRGMVTEDPSKHMGNFLFYLFSIFVIVLAVVLAVNCNPKNEFAFGLLAFLFSEIYLIQFFVRKYIINEKNYCTGIF